MSRQLEQRLQEQYIFYLRQQRVLFCASAGGLHTPNKAAAIRMKRAGYQSGTRTSSYTNPAEAGTAWP